MYSEPKRTDHLIQTNGERVKIVEAAISEQTTAETTDTNEKPNIKNLRIDGPLSTMTY
jgi:hypothetical protein